MSFQVRSLTSKRNGSNTVPHKALIDGITVNLLCEFMMQGRVDTIAPEATRVKLPQKVSIITSISDVPAVGYKSVV